MRRLPLGIAATAVGALALAAAATLLSRPASPSVHPDGGGPLGSAGEAQQVVNAVPAEGNPVTTFGIPLCITDGNPSVITSVGPWKSVGVFTLLGVRARTFLPTAQDTVIYAVDGYPPSVPDPLQDPVGLKVTNPCGSGPGTPYTELLVGLSAVDGAGGGGWQGIAVGYKSGSRDLTLRITDDLIICGPTTAAWCTSDSAPPTPPN